MILSICFALIALFTKYSKAHVKLCFEKWVECLGTSVGENIGEPVFYTNAARSWRCMFSKYLTALINNLYQTAYYFALVKQPR